MAQQGLTWGALNESVTPDYPFTAARVFIMVAVDIVLYALLAFYLDKVWCQRRDETAHRTSVWVQSLAYTS